MSTPGLKNNNPGNIVTSAIPWKGQIGIAGRFCVFDTPLNGIRALCKQLLTDKIVHNCRTITDIITRWAPPSENDTAAYIADVSKRMNIGATDPLDLRNPMILGNMATSIIWHENGQQPYSLSIINAAVDNALEGLKS